MKITPELIQYLESLARIELTPAEEATVGDQLQELLTYIDTLSQLDTDMYFQKGRAISLFDPLTMQPFAEHVTESIRPAHRNSPLSGNSFLQGVNDVFHLSTAIRLSGQSRCTKQYT